MRGVPSQQNDGPRIDRRTSAWLLLVVLASMAVYAPSLANEYAMDDVFIVRDNPMVAELRPIGEYFTSHYWAGVGETSNLFRPVTIWSYAVGVHLFAGLLGDAALVHHLGNVLLHGLATWLVYSLLRGVAVRAPVAVVAALVFGCHAIHSEVVAGVVGRAELLAFVPGAAAVLACLRWLDGATAARHGWALVAGLGLFLAFGAKESALAWLPFVPFYVVARGLRAELGSAILPLARRGLAAAAACGVVPLAVFLALRAHALADLGAPPDVHWAVNPLHEVTTLGRCVTATVVWAYGLYKTVLPLSLSADYGVHVFELRDSVVDPVFVFALGVLASTVAVGLLGTRRRPLAMLVVVTFFGFGFVTSNLPIPIGTIFGERLYYTPSLMASFVVAIVLERLAATTRLGKAARWTIALWVAVCCATILARNPVWRDDDSLFFHEVVNQPRSARMHVTVAGLLGRRGEIARGIEHCERAIAIAPDYAGAWINLGALRQQAGDLDGAEQALVRAGEARHRQREDEPLRRLNLAHLWIRTARADRAAALLEESAAMWPEWAVFEIARGDALRALGDRDAARRVLEQVLRRRDLDAAQRDQVEGLLRELR